MIIKAYEGSLAKMRTVLVLFTIGQKQEGPAREQNLVETTAAHRAYTMFPNVRSLDTF